MSKKLLFNFNREVIQDYTYVKYVGTIITATNTLEKPIKSATLKGSTKYRDIETGEFLETFEEGRNLELVSVKMPVLSTFVGGIHLKSDFEAGSIYSADGTNYDNISNRIRTKRSWSTNGGTKIIFDTNITLQRIVFYYNNSTFVSNSGNWSKYNEFKIPNGVNNFRIIFQASNIDSLPDNFHIMTNAKKTNILTVNEDVTLRSNGDVCDELNLLTGRLTQRIDENNEVLAQEVVKTVDLSILDQNENKVSSISSFNDTTHITASSETIPPIFEGYLATKEVE